MLHSEPFYCNLKYVLVLKFKFGLFINATRANQFITHLLFDVNYVVDLLNKGYGMLNMSLNYESSVIGCQSAFDMQITC